MEKAAVLVTADGRTTKDAARRKASLLPPTIQHEYFYAGKTAVNDGTIDTVDLLWDTMKRLTPAPTLLFPGKAGVMSVVEGLQSKYGFQDVRTLRDTEGEICDPAAPAKKWKDTTIYVVGEKFGRGLDIDGGVSYVLLSSPPSSPAAYLHLAGRTGRNGQPGRVVTLMSCMKEAKLVPAMGQALGITFSDLEPTVAGDESDSPTIDVPIESEVVVSETAPTEEAIPSGETNHPWKELSKTALTKKNVAEIVEYLTERVSTMD
jgi:superfamily II DNA/RNA helicase